MAALTGKQEAFAQAVAAGNNQSDAYREAYDAGNMKASSIAVNASKLMSDAKVAQRVASLRAPIAVKAQITLESHLADLMLLRDRALASGQYSAAITAEIARGKAAGVVAAEKIRNEISGAIDSRRTEDAVERMATRLEALAAQREAERASSH